MPLDLALFGVAGIARHRGGVGAAGTAVLAAATPPRPWLQATVSHLGDAEGMRLVAPLRHPEPPVVTGEASCQGDCITSHPGGSGAGCTGGASG